MTLPLDNLLHITQMEKPQFLTKIERFLDYLQQLKPTNHTPSVDHQCHIAFPEVNAQEPLSIRVLLKVLGYLSNLPYLQCFILHMICHELRHNQSNQRDQSLSQCMTCLLYLHNDTSNEACKLDALCRSILLHRPVQKVWGAPSYWTKHALKTPCSRNDARHILLLSRFRREIALLSKSHFKALHENEIQSTSPYLYIAPSVIPIAGLGLYLRGKLPEGTPIAWYSGVLVNAEEARVSGYTLQHQKCSIDASVERCVASMTNDARDPSGLFRFNCIFSSYKKRPVLKTSRIVHDEELLVDYGDSFTGLQSDACIIWTKARSRDPLFFLSIPEKYRFPAVYYYKGE